MYDLTLININTSLKKPISGIIVEKILIMVDKKERLSLCFFIIRGYFID